LTDFGQFSVKRPTASGFSSIRKSTCGTQIKLAETKVVGKLLFPGFSVRWLCSVKVLPPPWASQQVLHLTALPHAKSKADSFVSGGPGQGTRCKAGEQVSFTSAGICQ
jgi:hypothetical protein